LECSQRFLLEIPVEQGLEIRLYGMGYFWNMRSRLITLMLSDKVTSLLFSLVQIATNAVKSR
jgi:hypothetical protein